MFSGAFAFGMAETTLAVDDWLRIPVQRAAIVSATQSCQGLNVDYRDLQSTAERALNFNGHDNPFSDMRKLADNSSFRKFVECARRTRVLAIKQRVDSGNLRVQLNLPLTICGLFTMFGSAAVLLMDCLDSRAVRNARAPRAVN